MHSKRIITIDRCSECPHCEYELPEVLVYGGWFCYRESTYISNAVICPIDIPEWCTLTKEK